MARVVVPDALAGSLFDGWMGWFPEGPAGMGAGTVVCETPGWTGSIGVTAAATEAVVGSIANDWVEVSIDP